MMNCVKLTKMPLSRLMSEKVINLVWGSKRKQFAKLVWEQSVGKVVGLIFLL